MNIEKPRESNSGGSFESVEIERVLQAKRGSTVSTHRLRLRTPVLDDQGQVWTSEIECPLFASTTFKARGVDALQSLILAIRLVKRLVEIQIEGGVDVFWLEPGDGGGLDGIE